MAKNVGSYMRWLSLSNRLQAFGSRLKMFLFYGVFTLVAVPAPAWNDTGHKIVASIAYNELTPSGRIEVDTILKAHTNYNAWRAEHVSAHPNIDLGQFVFMQASTWPDEIRDNNDKKTHPHWHYIDYPLKEPTFPYKAAPKPKDNVVYAIGKNVDALEDIHAKKQKQAESLSWLEHLVGDIHQPLHCSSLFNSTFTSSEGDRGGNSFYIKMHSNSANPTKLHGLWDNLLGNSAAPDNQAKKAQDLAHAHPRSSFSAASFMLTPRDWSKESRSLALEKAYKPLPSLDGAKTHPVVAPADYIDKSKALAENQIVLAGYRLADLIRAILTVRGSEP